MSEDELEQSGVTEPVGSTADEPGSPGETDAVLAQSGSDSQQNEPQLVAEYRQLYAGPLPHSDEARQYEGLLPGSFDRILTMVEQEQSARIRLELQRHQDTVSRDKQLYQAAAAYNMRELESRSKRELAGMWLGFTLAAGVLLIAALVIFTGRSLEAGIALIVGDAVAIAAVFVHQTRSSRNDAKNPPEG